MHPQPLKERINEFLNEDFQSLIEASLKTELVKMPVKLSISYNEESGHVFGANIVIGGLDIYPIWSTSWWAGKPELVKMSEEALWSSIEKQRGIFQTNFGKGITKAECQELLQIAISELKSKCRLVLNNYPKNAAEKFWDMVLIRDRKDTHHVMDESLDIQVVTHLTEGVIAEGLLMEFLNYNQLVAATHDYFRNRFDNAKQVEIPQPDLVVLKSGDMDLTFGCRARSPGSGRVHYCGMVVFPDETTKKATVSRLKEWWGSLKARLNKFLGRNVPEKILTGQDLRAMKCKVTCDCEDYKYRFEVANKAKGASDIKHSNGARPNKTNPQMHPGICKHLLSLLRYLTDDATIQAKQSPTK